MKYNKNIDKLYDRINGKTQQKILNKAVSAYSTGGPVERSIKKRTGNIVNKNIEKRFGSAKVYKAIEKAYLNILQQQRKQ